ncbi:photosystem I reaction centre subunit VI [Prochlorococcus sp. MIT 1306]|uniref:photosystem I reaction centre subunit VI n=2 Tax=Prochlorococcus sp. MIT 1306 TaxID=1799667 RepID=UPI001E362F11|nr:photosystem I reaction centre subunit VI [Prochlorococcus sp. MIT 1306]
MPRIQSLLPKINNMKLPAKTALTAGIATAVIIILPYIVNLMFTVLPGFLGALASVLTPIFTAAGLAWLITYIWTKQ